MYRYKIESKITIIFVPLSHVLDTRKNNLIEVVLLSTQNICFGLELNMLSHIYPFNEGLNNVQGKIL